MYQNHGVGETEGDVLQQVDALTGIISILCTKYEELGGDGMPSSPDGVAEPTKPVVEQQEQRPRLLGASRALRTMEKPVPLREHEVAAVHEAVTAAIAGNTGARVHVHGPGSSGKITALGYQFDKSVNEWCKQHDKPKPVSVPVFLGLSAHPAGLYGEVLQELAWKGVPIDVIGETVADAKKQLEAVVFNTTHSSGSSSNSNLPTIVLKLHRFHFLPLEYTDQLQQLSEWTAGSKLILISAGRTELSQTVPQHGVVPVQVEFKCYTESDIVAILSANSGSVVQPLALELCAKQASGDVRRACELCMLAVKLADIDSNNSCEEVTLKHVEQAVSFLELE
jgi:hypothetical protein